MAQYVRNLLNSQQRIRLLEIQKDGRAVAEQIHQLRPDVVMIDSLLQGRMKGLQVAEQIRDEGADPPIIILTVPQNPVQVDPQGRRPGPLDALQRLRPGQHPDRHGGRGACRLERRPVPRHTLYAPKGGVGKTTLAFNLAVAMAQQGASARPSSTAASSSATCGRC